MLNAWLLSIFCTKADRVLVSFFAGASSVLLLSSIPNLWMLFCVLVLLLLVSIINRYVWLLSAFMLGFFWICWSAKSQVVFPEHLQGISLPIEGKIIGLPDESWQRTKFRFKIADDIADEQLSSQVIELSCYRCNLPIMTNQYWQFTVRLKRPYGYASWGAFDFEKYLFRHQVIARGYIRQNEVNQQLNEQLTPFSIDKQRAKIRHYLGRSFSSSPIAKGMFAALMIGDKSLLSVQQKRVFQHTGLSHLMAISGLHIGLVFACCLFVMHGLFWPFSSLNNIWPRQHWVLLPSLIAAIGYAALAGFAVSTQRALIMLSVFALCRIIAKQVTLLHILIMTAVLVLFVDPLAIMDIGFWLSFTAVLIIALISHNEPGSISLWRLQPMLWLGMLPLSLLFFSQVSLVSPLVNLLFVPLFCLLLIPLVLIALFCWLCNMLTISDWILTYLAIIFEFLFTLLDKLSGIELTQWHYPQIQWSHWLVYVFILVTYLHKYRYRHWLWLLLISSLLASPISNKLKQNDFEVVLLDVGQGLSMVVHTQNHTLVYDTGPKYGTGFSAAQAVLIPYLKYRGIKRVDTLIISHADNDHIGGYTDLRQSIPIQQTLTSRLDKIAEATECALGQQWQYDGVSFEIISPEINTPQGSNNRSCVLKVSNKHTSLLITGDIEKQVELFLLKHHQEKLKSDVMLVPHQGSKTSSNIQFIDAVGPELALVAAGYRNHYGHPHDEVMQRYFDRGITVYSTIKSGSISMSFKQEQRIIRQYRLQHQRFWHSE